MDVRFIAYNKNPDNNTFLRGTLSTFPLMADGASHRFRRDTRFQMVRSFTREREVVPLCVCWCLVARSFPSSPLLHCCAVGFVLVSHQVSNMLRQDLTYLSTHSGSTKGRIDVESDRLNAVASEAPVAVLGALVQVVGGLAWVASSK